MDQNVGRQGVKGGFKMRGMKKVCRILVIFLGLTLIFAGIFSGTSLAAPADFPKKPITLIVPLAPGGARDVIARGVGRTMSKYLGVSVVIMNTPGAGGALGMTKVYNSTPDGHTIGIGSVTEFIIQLFEKVDYDGKKFTYVGKIDHSPVFFFVKTDSPFRTVMDFKTFGNTIRYSTPSLGTNASLVSIILADRMGYPLEIVAGYQGGAAAVLGVTRGEGEYAASARATVMPFLKSKQIRPILTVDEKRSPFFPEIPIVGEIGYPDLAILGGLDFMLMGPPGVPKDRVRILEDALLKTLKDAEFLKWATEAGVETAPLGAQETTQFAFNLVELVQKYQKYLGKYIAK